MNILRNKRNMTRAQAIMFGLRSRSKSIGWVRSVGKTMSILGIDSLKFQSQAYFTAAALSLARVLSSIQPAMQ